MTPRLVTPLVLLALLALGCGRSERDATLSSASTITGPRSLVVYYETSSDERFESASVKERPDRRLAVRVRVSAPRDKVDDATLRCVEVELTREVDGTEVVQWDGGDLRDWGSPVELDDCPRREVEPER